MQACLRRIGAPPTDNLWNLRFKDLILKHGANLYTKNYKGYQYVICASVNDVNAHGFPSDIPLEEGDIVTIDTVAELDRGLVFDQSQVLSYKIAEETQGLYGFD